MKFPRVSSAFLLCLGLVGCESLARQDAPARQHASTSMPTLSTAQEHADDKLGPGREATPEHVQKGESHPALHLDQGQPWPTDVALVEGMERVRDAVSDAAARSALDTEAAAALARAVRGEVDFLIANCRLEPDADATLHVFLAQLLSAAAALEKNPAAAGGLPQLRQTLREYPHYFAHPGWQAESGTTR